jgi:hypothetical protein
MIEKDTRIFMIVTCSAQSTNYILRNSFVSYYTEAFEVENVNKTEDKMPTWSRFGSAVLSSFTFTNSEDVHART